MKTKITKIFNKLYHYVDDVLVLVTDEYNGFSKVEFRKFCNATEPAIKIICSDIWNDDNDRLIEMTRYDFIKIIEWIMTGICGNNPIPINTDSFIYSKRPVRCPIYYKTYDSNGNEVTDDSKLVKNLTVSELSISESETYGNNDKLTPHLTIYHRDHAESIFWLALSKEQYEEFKKLEDDDVIYADLVCESLRAYKCDIDYISVYDVNIDIPEEIPFD